MRLLVGPMILLASITTLQACQTVAVEEEPPIIEEPEEPFRTSSQLSFFGLNESFGETYGGGSSIAILVTDQGTAIHHTLDDSKFTGTYISAGGYNTTSVEDIDRIRIHAGAFALEPFDYNPRLYLTLGDRIDEEGGATDVFEAELRDLYSSPAPARIVIFNSDHAANSALDFAAVVYWDIDFAGWGEFEPFEMFGTSTISNRDIIEMGTYGSGSAIFDGRMFGVYRPASGPEEMASGVASVTVDFSAYRTDGYISEISTPTRTLQDIVLQVSDFGTGGSGTMREPFSGLAYTDDYDADAGTATMIGRYDALLHYDAETSYDPSPSDYLTGNIALTGSSGDLVGGVIAHRQ